MIRPIVAYGDPVLRQRAEPISPDYPALEQVISDMFETMYNASGVGLAAPQIGLSIRIFVVDGSPMDPREEIAEPEMDGFKGVFINPRKVEENEKPWPFEEGCLSIPGLRENVNRPNRLVLNYYDEHWNQHTNVFTGMRARILQHEYDHLEGVLFTDYASSFRKRLLRPKLSRISKGVADVSYAMRFPNGK